jgi:uncharacterized protein YcfJ
MKSAAAIVSIAALGLSLGGCASTRPAGPTLAVMPGQAKSYDAFQRDEAFCQSQAQRAIGYESPGAAANDQAVAGAAVGTALGAVAGAAIGAASGNAGRGAAIGAGAGLLGGAAVGSANGQEAGGSIQARYDLTYAQCMRARGNEVLAPPPPPVTTVVYERRAPVYVYSRPYAVYPRPYYGGTVYRRW